MLIDWKQFPELRGGKRGMVRKAVSTDKLSAMLVKAPAETEFDGKLHHHVHEQVLVVLSGQCSIQIENDVVTAVRDDLVFFPSNARHAVVGVGPEGATYYELSTPARTDLLPGWIGESALRY